MIYILLFLLSFAIVVLFICTSSLLERVEILEMKGSIRDIIEEAKKYDER